MLLNVVEAGQGAGAPVALLHGLFGQARNFGAAQRALAERGRRVLALDLRNHGDSGHDPRHDYAAMADDVAETLRAAGARPAAVIGHSMGGKAAMALALRDPAAVSRLLVADIAPVRYPAGFRAFADAMRAVPLRPGLTRREADAALAGAVPDAGVRAFLLGNLRLDADPPRWRIGLEQIAAALPLIEDWDPAATLPPAARFDGPVLVLRGGRSRYVRPEHEALFRALFPRARFDALERAGHWLHAEDPDGFLAAVTAFLDAGE